MRTRFKQVLMLTLLLGQPAYAQSFVSGGYVIGNLVQHNVTVDNTRFTLPAFGVSGGVWVGEGIGIELGFGSGGADDTRNGLELDLDSLVTLGVRLEAPPKDELALYVLFMASAAELSSRFTDLESRSAGSSLNGFGGTLGVTWHPAAAPAIAVDAGVTHHRFDSDLGFNTFNLGLRYSFGGAR